MKFDPVSFFRIGDDVQTPLGRRARIMEIDPDGRFILRYYDEQRGMLYKSDDGLGAVNLPGRLLKFYRAPHR